MAIVKPAPEYTLDDIESDLQHLYDLIDTIVASMVGINRLDMDCGERNELDRASSLAWIARDQLELIRDQVDQKNDADAAASS